MINTLKIDIYILKPSNDIYNRNIVIFINEAIAQFYILMHAIVTL